jgi:hypothetical protein
MTLCPIAIAVGCQKCPLFKICPVKTIIGDAPPTKDEKTVSAPKSPKKTPGK